MLHKQSPLYLIEQRIEPSRRGVFVLSIMFFFGANIGDLRHCYICMCLHFIFVHKGLENLDDKNCYGEAYMKLLPNTIGVCKIQVLMLLQHMNVNIEQHLEVA